MFISLFLFIVTLKRLFVKNAAPKAILLKKREKKKMNRVPIWQSIHDEKKKKIQAKQGNEKSERIEERDAFLN